MGQCLWTKCEITHHTSSGLLKKSSYSIANDMGSQALTWNRAKQLHYDFWISEMLDNYLLEMP